ncbi:MAG: GNAT family N-acetyltransferase [Planctomycetota bacterium]
MIRDVTPADTETVLEAAEQSGLFSGEEIVSLREQLERALGGDSDRAEHWIADFDGNGTAIGAALYAEELFTDRVWNLLFIEVRRPAQGTGVGGSLLRFVEDRLRSDAQRMLLIETTVGPEFEGTQAFYRRNGYEHRGTIPDFYADGQDKIVFLKRLDGST